MPTINYPIWFVGLCLLLGTAYASFLYVRERRMDELSPIWKWGLAIFRFISVSTIALLLLNPLLASTKEIEEKPVLIIGHDNSKSLLLSKDSSFYKKDYLSELNSLKTKLKSKYQLDEYVFGNEVNASSEVSFQDDQTNIAHFFNEVYSRYYNRNIGGIILASDGIFNNGSNPLNYAERIKNTPIYSVALGDTTIRQDLMVDKVNHNRIAYLGNEFPIEVQLKADKLIGKKTVLKVMEGNKVLFSENIEITQDNWLTSYPFRIEATKSGLRKYSVFVDVVEGEFTIENNTQDIYIDVLNNKQKILFLVNSPHPDVAAVRRSAEQYKNYNVEVKLASDFDGNTKPYSLVMLHQLPSTKNKIESTISSLKQQKTPALFFLGSKSNMDGFNTFKTGLNIIGFRGKTDEVGTSLNSGFNSFVVSSDVKNELDNFPPLTVPFATYRMSNSANVLMYQKLGSLVKSDPLIMFSKANNSKYGIIAGEGIWRWSLMNPEVFNKLTSKVIQYLAVKEDKSFFRISGKRQFTENENVVFDAEVYNETYELINEPEISFSYKDEGGNEYPQNFEKLGRGYRLNLRKLAAGTYTYSATVDINGRTENASGEFSVKALKIELTNVVADHNLMFNLADQNNGKLFYPNQLKELYEAILERDDIRPIAYEQKKFDSIINLKWIFFLIMALLSVEWFLRKRNGAY